MNLKINRLQHVGIPVTDIVKSASFYKKLGFKNVMETSFDYSGEKGNVVMMKSGEIIIELYQLPGKELTETRNRKDGHIDHIAFDVDDINKAFETLQKDSFDIIESQPVFLPFWKNGCKYFNISGPDGERLEFNQIL